MTFEECLLHTAKTPELYEEFCRLNGDEPPTTAIEQMVDEATGREDDIIARYAGFVLEFIYLPLVPEERAA